MSGSTQWTFRSAYSVTSTDRLWACITDIEADPENVVVAIAMRDVATFQLWIPRAKWDGPLFLDMLEKHAIH